MRTMWVKAAVVVFALVLSVSALAADTPATNGSGKVQIPASGVQFSGKQIAGGEYSMKWSGTGEQVNVTLLKGRQHVAVATAKLVAISKAPADDAVVYNAEGKLTEVRFRGKKITLVFSD